MQIFISSAAAFIAARMTSTVMGSTIGDLLAFLPNPHSAFRNRQSGLVHALMLPAINDDVGAGDPACGWAGDEGDDPRHFLWGTEAAKRNRFAHLLEVSRHAFFNPLAGSAFEINRAGRDGVGADAFGGKGLAEVVGVS